MIAGELQYIDEDTGEVIESHPSAVDLSVGGLVAYARARVRRDAASVAMAERVAEIIKGDAEAARLQQEMTKLGLEVAVMEDNLAAAFDPAVRLAHGSGIVLDVGAVRVTWPKPSRRVVQRVKPADILRDNAALAKRLGISESFDKPRPPIITVRADKLGGAL